MYAPLNDVPDYDETQDEIAELRARLAAEEARTAAAEAALAATRGTAAPEPEAPAAEPKVETPEAPAVPDAAKLDALLAKARTNSEVQAAFTEAGYATVHDIAERPKFGVQAMSPEDAQAAIAKAEAEASSPEDFLAKLREIGATTR